MYDNLSPEQVQRFKEERIKRLNYNLAYYKKRIEAILETIDVQRVHIRGLIKRGYDVHDHYDELRNARAALNGFIDDYDYSVEAVQSIEKELGLPVTPYESIPHVAQREVPKDTW